jgi:uncharacterized membrane protein
MIKHIVAIVALSILVILTMPHIQTGLQALLSLHDWISETLKIVFSDGQAGNVSRELIASLSVPFLVGIIPAGLYWIVKRSLLPHFILIVWVTWLVQTSALVILYSNAAA